MNRINDISFCSDVGRGRQLRYRLNTLEDLFSGPPLEKRSLNLFTRLVRKHYDVPLHYELILTAQVELKRRNHHIAILEAETAFEVYIARVLVETSVAVGLVKSAVISEMEDARRLGLLSKRLRRLDSVVGQYRMSQSLVKLPPFVNSTTYTNWKSNLYD